MFSGSRAIMAQWQRVNCVSQRERERVSKGLSMRL